MFGDFSDPVLRNQAVAALGAHGPMALVVLDKYAHDPDFREILRAHGAAIIPPIAQADTGPEVLTVLQSKERRSFTESLAKLALLASGDNGQAVIRMIKNDGLDRVAYLNRGDIRYYQFLPLYDVLHLGNVLGSGHSPTSGEMTWALVDGCFVVLDVLSLTAMQPEGAVAAEAVRSEVKAAAREGARSLGRELTEAGSESVGKSLARSGARRVGGCLGRGCHPPTFPLVGCAVRRRNVPGDAPVARSTAQDEPDTGRLDGPAALHQGWPAADPVAALRAAAAGSDRAVPHPSGARSQVRGGADAASFRRCRWLSKNGRTPGLSASWAFVTSWRVERNRAHGKRFPNRSRSRSKLRDRGLRGISRVCASGIDTPPTKTATGRWRSW